VIIHRKQIWFIYCSYFFNQLTHIHPHYINELLC